MAIPEPAAQTVELAVRDAVVRFLWAPAPGADTEDAVPSPWRLESEPDWKRLENIRLVSAAFDDGAALGLASLRARGARGHGDDAVVARVIDADGQEKVASEALVSVEYDAEGTPRRLGLELWIDPDSPPLRVAADREGDSPIESERGRQAIPMTFRLDGTAGSGRYEILRPD